MELSGFCAAIIFIRFEGYCKNNKYYAWWNAAGRRRLRWVEAEMTTGLMKKLVSNNFLSTRVGFTLPFCGTNYIRDQDISVPQPVRTIIKGFPTSSYRLRGLFLPVPNIGTGKNRFNYNLFLFITSSGCVSFSSPRV